MTSALDPEPQWILQPPVSEFAFSWNSEILHANIVVVKPDYEPRDPRTWPLVTRNMINARDLNEFMQPERLISLPTTVAYESSLMKQLQVRVKINSKTGYGKHVRFMSHPLNFNLRSELRPLEKVCMTMSDHTVWLRKRKTEERQAAAERFQSALATVPITATNSSTTGPATQINPATKRDPTTQTDPVTQKSLIFESNGLTYDAPTETEGELTDPATTFERIMNTLAEQTTSPKVAALQHELSEAHAQIQAEKARADHAERELMYQKLKTT